MYTYGCVDNEPQVNTLREAAVLADEFALTHHVFFKDRHKSNSSQSSHTEKSNNSSSNSEPICYYCKKPRHIVVECPVLKKKQAAKAIGLIKATPQHHPFLHFLMTPSLGTSLFSVTVL